LRICLILSIQYINVTDRQTDGQTDRQTTQDNTASLCTASQFCKTIVLKPRNNQNNDNKKIFSTRHSTAGIPPKFAHFGLYSK